MFIVLMISAIIIVDISWVNVHDEAKLNFERQDLSPSMPTEQGVFRRVEYALEYENMAENTTNNRNLTAYYSKRAYPGAPPIIPHPILNNKNIGAKNCLQCHQNGGYVSRFDAYAPITPHPEMTNCKQCHLPAKTNQLFVATHWEKTTANKIHNSALSGSPPVIPHSLQMRENCLACHAGPAAVKEIRVSHPTRINCRQCHVPMERISSFSAPWDSANQFIRKPK